MLCCKEVGFLGTEPAEEQNLHSQLQHNAAVWVCFWGKHPLAEGRALPSAEWQQPGDAWWEEEMSFSQCRLPQLY